MGISHDNRHKKRLTGGRMPVHQKKRLKLLFIILLFIKKELMKKVVKHQILN